MTGQPVRFKLNSKELERLRNIAPAANGLHIIDRFKYHPGYRGVARDDSGLGLALPDPDEDQLAFLARQMLEESAAGTGSGYGWGI